MVARFVVLGILWQAAFNALVLPCAAATSCASLTSEAKDLIVRYLKNKQELPVNLAMKVVDDSPMEGSCYRRLQIRSVDPHQSFQVSFYLSPDQRFLSTDLFDAKSDPVKEERRQQEAIQLSLAKSSSAALGSKSAPVTIVVFSDFQCPYCKGAADMLREQVLPFETNNLRIVFRHLPLSFHAWARPAAEATSCALRQSNEAFWLFHDYLFAHQQALTEQNINTKLTEQARSLRSFDVPEYLACVRERKSAADVQEDVDFALDNQVSGTPTMFINGKRFAWSGKAEQIRTLIQQTISQQGTTATTK